MASTRFLQVACDLRRWVFVLGFTLALPSAAWAWTIEGQVMAVQGGDILKVRDDRHVTHTVHVAGVDAPARGQTHYTGAEMTLREVAFQRYVIVQGNTTPGKSGVRQGTVRTTAGDVGQALLEQGAVWFNRADVADLSQELRKVYGEAEEQAHLRRVGLWRPPNPIPPWDFRAGRRK
jgi:micrococcal nuclease